MNTTFQCADCGQIHEVKTNGGTGYATLPDGGKICYPCADVRQRADLKDRSRPFTGYVSSDGKTITIWTGGHLMTITQAWPVKLPRWSHWHGSTIQAIRAVDCHGGKWYGRGSPGLCINLRPCK